MNEMTRAELEEAGFEALQRLYALAIDYALPAVDTARAA